MSDLVAFNFSKEKITSGVCSPSLQDWRGFFESLRYQQYQKLAQCKSEEERIELQQAVKGISLVEIRFATIHDQKKFT